MIVVFFIPQEVVYVFVIQNLPRGLETPIKRLELPVVSADHVPSFCVEFKVKRNG